MSESEQASEALRWLRFAQEDLVLAERLVSEQGNSRHVCWLAQQAAEKAIKGGLVCLAVPFPKRHDLDGLANLLPGHWQVKESFPKLGYLTRWAVESRYPTELPEPSEADAEEAAHESRAVVEAMIADLAARGLSTGYEPEH